jgi:phage repressor protein C with HTH and peptisase S24 domain
VAGFDEIFARVKLATNTRTQAELAEVLGIRQSSISDAKRRNSLPADWYMKLFEHLGLNPLWLKYGTAPMYLCPEQGHSSLEARGHPLSLPENAARYNEPDAKGIIVPVYSRQEAYNPENPAASIGKLNIPVSFAHPGLYVIRFDASSMEPFVKKGAYVGLDTTRQSVASGELYGINLPHEGVVIKRIYIDSPNNSLVLKSENPAHPAMTLPISEQRHNIVGLLGWILQKM